MGNKKPDSSTKTVVGIILAVVTLVIGFILIVVSPFGEKGGFNQEVGYSDLNGTEVEKEVPKTTKDEITKGSTDEFNSEGWKKRIKKGVVGYKLETLEEDIFDLFLDEKYSEFRKVYNNAGIFNESADILQDDGTIQMNMEFEIIGEDEDSEFDYGEPLTNLTSLATLEALYVGGGLGKEDTLIALNGVRVIPKDETGSETTTHKVDTKLLQQKYNIEDTKGEYEIQFRYPEDVFKRIMKMNDDSEGFTQGVVRAQLRQLGGNSLVQTEPLTIPLEDTITLDMSKYQSTIQTDEGNPVPDDSFAIERYLMDIYLVEKGSDEGQQIEMRVEENKLYLR